MEVIIIEDEKHAAEKLQRQLVKINPNITILAILDSVATAVKWLQANEPDLIFLDIHLGDSDCFKIFERVDVKTPIIFTTAYDKYAIQAFKLNSVDYLLKPVNQKDLEAALNKYSNLHRTEPVLDYARIADAIQNKAMQFQKRFMVYSGDKIKSIEKDDVAYFLGEGKYCYLIAFDDQQYLIDFTLDKLVKVLDPEIFFRINRQLIISISSIRQMHSYPKGRVKIDLNPSNKKEAIVSIERASEFKKWLNR